MEESEFNFAVVGDLGGTFKVALFAPSGEYVGDAKVAKVEDYLIRGLGEHNLAKEHNYYITELEVQDSWQNLGLGTKIMEYILANSKVPKLYVHPLPLEHLHLTKNQLEQQLDRLVSWYKRFGFKIVYSNYETSTVIMEYSKQVQSVSIFTNGEV